MKVFIVARTIRHCPKPQLVEKEIYGDTIKKWVKDLSMDLGRCTDCNYHGGIEYFANKQPPKVTCRYEEATKKELKKIEIDGVVYEVEIKKAISADPNWVEGKSPRVRLVEEK